ncbi:MAG: branched-chain amino acid ABC transporter permease [Pseudolabrys sp.]|jgi:branched-chain amino acid transport system permease protein
MLIYILTILTFGSIYALLALGLNLMWGMAGLVNLGILAYYALGGYVSALLTVKLGFPVFAGMLIGTLAAALLGAVTCVGLVKLRDDYLAIATLGFAQVMALIAQNEVWLTNGTDGIGQVPRLGVTLQGETFSIVYLLLCLLVVGLVFAGSEILRRSPFGRVLRAIRDDAMVAATAGKHVFGFQMKALAVGGGIMGLAGACYVHYIGFISPEVFQPQLLIYIFLALILGGRGNNVGAVAGAFFVVIIVEGTRFIAELAPSLSAVQVGAIRQLIIGVGFIVVLQKWPRGMFPEPLRAYREPNGERPTASTKVANDLAGRQ